MAAAGRTRGASGARSLRPRRMRRVKRLEREAPAGEVKELRAEIGRRIDWIGRQEEEPAALPWEEFSIAEGAA